MTFSDLVWTQPGEELFRATRRIRRHLSSLSNRTLVLLAVLLARSLAHGNDNDETTPMMSYDVTMSHEIEQSTPKVCTECLSGFDWPERRLLKKYSAEIRESYRMARMNPQNLVVILHAYGRRGFLGLL